MKRALVLAALLASPACAADGGGMARAVCAVASKNSASPDKPIDWTDTIYLVNDGGSWRVDDIAFGGNWDFGSHGTLCAELKEAISGG